MGLVQGTNGVLLWENRRRWHQLLGGRFQPLDRRASVRHDQTNHRRGRRRVTIIGYGLTDATSVTFNGIPTAFNVDAATAITTTVPAGATSGKVQVVTPSGTLSSNVSFEVAP